MTERVEISCIDKSDRGNPFERIKGVGGVNPDGTKWVLSDIAAINGIKSGKWQFYVVRGGHSHRVLVARTPWGYEYLKADVDGDSPDTLLGLPAPA